jgi:hypothetical protein
MRPIVSAILSASRAVPTLTPAVSAITSRRADAALVQHFNADGPHHSRLAVRKLACCPRRQRGRITTDAAALDVFNPHGFALPPARRKRARPSPSLFSTSADRFAVIWVGCGSSMLPLHRDRPRPGRPKGAARTPFVS